MKKIITPMKAMLMVMLFFCLGATASHRGVEVRNFGPKKQCQRAANFSHASRSAAACPCAVVSGATYYFLDSSGQPFSAVLCDGVDSISGTFDNGDAYYDGDGYYVRLAAGSQVTFSVDSCTGNPVSLTVCDSLGTPIAGAFAASACPNSLNFTAPYDGDYYIVMNVNGVDGGAGSVGIGNIYCVRQTGTTLPACVVVANDALCNAIALTVNGTYETSNTTPANVYDVDDAAVDASITCSTPNNTLWYYYTAAVAETLEVAYTSPVGGLDGWLVAFETTNLCVDPLTFIDCYSGPSGIGDTVFTTFNMTAGTTYAFMVDGVSGAVGEFSIGLRTLSSGSGSLIPNDPLCGAIALTVGGPFESADNTLADPFDADDAVLDPSITCSAANNTLWYSYTPTAPDTITVTFTSPVGGLQGWLVVFTSTNPCVDPANYVDCYAGPTGAGDTARINLPVATGQTYLFMVDGVSGSVGAFSIGLQTPVSGVPCSVNPNAVWLFTDPSGTGGFTGYICDTKDSVSATGTNMYWDGDAYSVNLYTGSQVTFRVDDCTGNPVALTICDSTGTPIPGAYSSSACLNSINYTATYDGKVYCVMSLGGICGSSGSSAIGSLYCVRVPGTILPTCAPAPVNDTICGAVALVLNAAAVSGNTTTAEGTDPRDADVLTAGYGACSTPNNTLWYSFTPSVADSFDVVLTDDGSGFVSWLGIFSTPAGANACNGTLTNESPTGDCFEGTNQVGVGGTFAGTATQRLYMDPANTYYIMVDGFSGAVGPFTIAVNSVAVGLNEFEQNIRQFQIFPNPANDMINVKYAFHDLVEVTIQLLDITGRVVYQSQLDGAKTGEHFIDAKAFTNGLYQLRLVSNSGSSTRKVIIQH